VRITQDAEWPLVTFRALSPEAHAALLEAAAFSGLSVPGYLRRLVAQDLEGVGMKPSELPPGSFEATRWWRRHQRLYFCEGSTSKHTYDDPARAECVELRAKVAVAAAAVRDAEKAATAPLEAARRKT
jgi:hypothetical protein